MQLQEGAAGSAEGRVSLTLAGACLLAEGLHGREGEPVVPLRHNWRFTRTWYGGRGPRTAVVVVVVVVRSRRSLDHTACCGGLPLIRRSILDGGRALLGFHPPHTRRRRRRRRAALYRRHRRIWRLVINTNSLTRRASQLVVRKGLVKIYRLQNKSLTITISSSCGP